MEGAAQEVLDSPLVSFPKLDENVVKKRMEKYVVEQKVEENGEEELMDIVLFKR